MITFVDNCFTPQYGESVTMVLSDYAPVEFLNTSGTSLWWSIQSTWIQICGIGDNTFGQVSYADSGHTSGADLLRFNSSYCYNS